MKPLTILTLVMCLVPALGSEFKSIKVDYAAKARFVEQLSGVRLADVKIEKMNLSAAISKICRGNEGKEKSPVVSYAISFPSREINADPFSEDPIEKAKIDPFVSYSAKDTSFTSVLDSICAQARYVWSIADDGKGRSFLLIEYKGEPAGADQPATKPADKPPVKDQPSTPTSKDGPR